MNISNTWKIGTNFHLYKEVFLDDSKNDPRERFVIYRLGEDKAYLR